MKALQYLLDTVRKMRELEMIELRDGDDNRRTALMYAALYVYPGTARFGLYPRLFIASHCTSSFNGGRTRVRLRTAVRGAKNVVTSFYTLAPSCTPKMRSADSDLDCFMLYFCVFHSVCSIASLLQRHDSRRPGVR